MSLGLKDTFFSVRSLVGGLDFCDDELWAMGLSINDSSRSSFGDFIKISISIDSHDQNRD